MNDGFIILLAIFGFPLIISLYVIMPNDKNCNSCQVQLSPNRIKTYHRKLKGIEKEVCKRCFK